jgi:CRP-like cAMP-binding protein
MLFHLKDKFPKLRPFLDKYVPFQVRIELAAKTVLLEEGKVSSHYYFVEKGCIRAGFNNNGKDKTVQFFFENEGLTSLESFLNNTPSFFTIETVEPSILYLLPKEHVISLLDELSLEPSFFKLLLRATAERQMHYMHEFVSFIKDTPEERYLNLLKESPHIIQRVPQHYIASYLGVTTVHLSRIKAKIAKRKPHD